MTMDTLTVEQPSNLRRASLISEIYAEGASSAFSPRSRGKLHGLVGIGGEIL